MKEIKCRVWTGTEMVNGNPTLLIDSSNGAVFETVTALEHEWNEARYDWIPLLFTGLKDKNGKEICEGDIVVINIRMKHSVIYSCKTTITFDDGAFWFTGNGYTDCNWHLYREEDRLILGNIYENPEMLEPENAEGK